MVTRSDEELARWQFTTLNASNAPKTRHGLFSAHYEMYATAAQQHISLTIPPLPEVLSALVTAYAMPTRLDFALRYLHVDHACMFVGLVWVDDANAIGKCTNLWTDDNSVIGRYVHNSMQVYVHVGELDDLDALARRLHVVCGAFRIVYPDSVEEIAEHFDKLFAPSKLPYILDRNLVDEQQSHCASLELADDEPRIGCCARVYSLFGGASR